jgi:hypothetical protein
MCDECCWAPRLSLTSHVFLVVVVVCKWWSLCMFVVQSCVCVCGGGGGGASVILFS